MLIRMHIHIHIIMAAVIFLVSMVGPLSSARYRL